MIVLLYMILYCKCYVNRVLNHICNALHYIIIFYYTYISNVIWE